MARTPEQIEADAEANRQRLQRAEALALALLFGRTAAVKNPAQLKRVTIATIGDIRRIAARNAAEQVLSELGDTGVRIGRNSQAIISIRRTETIAENLARRLRELRSEKLPGSEIRRQLRPSLERIGVTESSDSYNRTRRETAKEARVALFRRWDATLDMRTCPVCERADGMTVGIDEPFEIGEPGGVHPRCRCSWELLRADEL